MIVVGAYQVMSVQLSIGQLIAFNMLAVQALMPMSKLVDLWQQSIRAQVGLMLISDILSLPAEQAVGAAPTDRHIRGDISLQNVLFRYRPDLDRYCAISHSPCGRVSILGWWGHRVQAKVLWPVYCSGYMSRSKG